MNEAADVISDEERAFWLEQRAGMLKQVASIEKRFGIDPRCPGCRSARQGCPNCGAKIQPRSVA